MGSSLSLTKLEGNKGWMRVVDVFLTCRVRGDRGLLSMTFMLTDGTGGGCAEMRGLAPSAVDADEEGLSAGVYGSEESDGLKMDGLLFKMLVFNCCTRWLFMEVEVLLDGDTTRLSRNDTSPAIRALRRSSKSLSNVWISDL